MSLQDRWMSENNKQSCWHKPLVQIKSLSLLGLLGLEARCGLANIKNLKEKSIYSLAFGC